MSRMLEEVRQQPAALERTLAGSLRGVDRFRQLMRKRRPRLVVLVARGTSDNAALFGRYLLEIVTGIPVSLAAPSIATLYQARMDYRDALVVAISQSGESTDTNLVLERARAQGALTLGITNESASALARIAEHTLLVRAGPEKSVAATKTYTGQMLMMYLLAYALGGRVRIADLERIPGLVEQALGMEAEIDELSCRYRFMRHAVVMGRGLNYSNAFELSLKLMETCYVVAERFSSADFLHGQARGQDLRGDDVGDRREHFLHAARQADELRRLTGHFAVSAVGDGHDLGVQRLEFGERLADRGPGLARRGKGEHRNTGGSRCLEPASNCTCLSIAKREFHSNRGLGRCLR